MDRSLGQQKKGRFSPIVVDTCYPDLVSSDPNWSKSSPSPFDLIEG